MIFTLLYNQGNFVLSRNFRLQKVGDMRWLKKNYDFSNVAFSIDELVVLDVSRGERNLEQFCNHLKDLTDGCFVPIAAGGGVRCIDDGKFFLRSGADKIVVNTPLFRNPELISQLASEFGQQCIVASVDTKYTERYGYQVWTDNGSTCVEGTLALWLESIKNFPIGDLYLNSIDRDGTGQGYDMKMLDELPNDWSMPVILAGGAGQYRHLAEGLSDDRVDAFATAHLFNFVGDGLTKSRNSLLDDRYDLAYWDIDLASALKQSVK